MCAPPFTQRHGVDERVVATWVAMTLQEGIPRVNAVLPICLRRNVVWPDASGELFPGARFTEDMFEKHPIGRKIVAKAHCFAEGM